jgi:hypothetical protein
VQPGPRIVLQHEVHSELVFVGFVFDLQFTEEREGLPERSSGQQFELVRVLERGGLIVLEGVEPCDAANRERHGAWNIRWPQRVGKELLVGLSAQADGLLFGRRPVLSTWKAVPVVTKRLAEVVQLGEDRMAGRATR